MVINAFEIEKTFLQQLLLANTDCREALECVDGRWKEFQCREGTIFGPFRYRIFFLQSVICRTALLIFEKSDKSF